MRSRLTVSSLLAAIIVPASSASAAPQQQVTAGPTGIGIRLVGVPADSGNGPLANSYIVDRLAPGTSIRRVIEITNGTRSTADVAVYPAGAAFRRGAFAFAPGHSQNELSSWASVSRGVLRLPSGAKAFETVTIDVPKHASSGERYAVIWAEVSAPPPASGGVTLVNRVGVRMYVSIGRGGAPPSNFAIGALTGTRTATGAPLVAANVRNNGRRTLDISGTLTLSKGPGGLSAGPFSVKLGTTLAPNSSEPVRIRLDTRLPSGPWQARLLLSSGLVEREARATIRFPDLAPARSDNHLILVVILLLLSLTVAATALLLSRHRRLGRAGSTPA